MQALGKDGNNGGAGNFLRNRVRPAVRRAMSKVEPLDRAAERYSARNRDAGRLTEFFRVLQRAYLPKDAASASDEIPSNDEIARLQRAVTTSQRTYHDFFSMLALDGEVDRAMIAMTRRLIAAGDSGRARVIAQALQRYEDLRPVADICVAMCAIGEPMPDTAWTLFSRNDLSLVTRFLPGEYFRFAFGHDAAAASDGLRRALDGDVPIDANAEVWYDIAFNAFAAGCEDVSAGALEKAEQLLASRPQNDETKQLRERIEWLSSWHGRAAEAQHAGAAPAGEIPFALVDFRHPNLTAVSDDLGDHLLTLSAFGHLLRHEQVRFTGDPKLVQVAGDLAGSVASERRIARSTASSVQLTTIDRDASTYADVPAGTWAVVYDWFVKPLAGRHFDIPMNANLRPIFVSFHTTVAALKAPGAIEYLRRYAPIGCLDWDTVFLLHAAGIPAFFTGGLTATADLVVRAQQGTGEPVFVNTASDGSGERRSQLSAAVAKRDLAANLTAARDFVRELATHSRVFAGDLRTYLAVRGVGGTAELRSAEPGVARVQDHLDISAADLAAIQRGLSDKLAAVFTAILDGRSEDEVYDVWREVCSADVAAALKILADVDEPPKLSFDLSAVCSAILERAVTIERSDATAQGNEINVEFSLDGNYKHQLDIVLDSVVATTSRPVRAFVLCRQHGPDDYARMAKLFPTVSFVWLPTDNVDYGRISGMNKWVTPATMDRTILPVLLPEVDRMLHFDLDAMCLTDLGELFDVDMQGAGIASTPEPQPHYGSGFETYKRSANRLRREGMPDRARKLIIRTHAKDRFDFPIFNAGIMVMDLAQMRADDFCGRYLAYVQEYGLNGQVVLNAYVGNTLKVTEPDWNRLMRARTRRFAEDRPLGGPDQAVG